jgi:hypothetical protein
MTSMFGQLKNGFLSNNQRTLTKMTPMRNNPTALHGTLRSQKTHFNGIRSRKSRKTMSRKSRKTMSRKSRKTMSRKSRKTMSRKSRKC